MTLIWAHQAKVLLNLVYPRQCIGCGRSALEDGFQSMCWECWSTTTRLEAPFCQHCGDPVSGAVDHSFICYACTEKTPAFDLARSAARYDGVLGEALRQLKYKRALWLVPDVAEIMLHCLEAEYFEFAFDCVVPVPLYRVRRRERGFNQSEELAKSLARKAGISFMGKVVRRIRPTATQTHLTAKDRLSNVTAAFRMRRGDHVKGKIVLLVDDVMTTGATANACAKALKEGGAATVCVLTAARG